MGLSSALRVSIGQISGHIWSLKYSSLQVPEKILVWSVHVLTAILTIVKPVYLYDVHCIQELYKKISEGYSTSFPAKVCYILHVYIGKNCVSLLDS